MANGIGAPGNEGVSASIKGSEYSIGYVELAYALTSKMNYATIQIKMAISFYPL